jgi:two-component sensor histidine kinase
MDKIESLNTTIKMLEKDKKIKDALFKLTHEIKNPLAVCKGYIDMIDLNKEEKALKYINIMKQEINRSLNIISDFVEYNKIKVVKEQIDLNCLLDDVYDSFKILMTNKKIKLEYKNRNDQEIYFNGDYERLKQVIINILKNACEACTENGKIEISSNLYKNYLDILIEDNGIGMDEETLKNIKEMFYTTKQNGTGLGVALSNEIIKSHNGELLFTSELNKGTKVTIRLPY